MASNSDNNCNKSSTVPPLVDLLGPTIIRNKEGDNADISVADLARTKKTVVLYFSAHWCPPCRGFTPTLSEAYAKYKSSSVDTEDGEDGFELIFVSSDRGADAFQEYHSEMSFPALPYESRDIKTKLSKKFSVEGIPHLVAVDAATGEEDTSVSAALDGDLRSFIVQNGAAAFPLCPAHIQKMKAESDKKQVDALAKLAVSPVIVSVPCVSSLLTNGAGKNEETIPKTTTIKFGELLEQYEYIGIVFGDGDKTDATYDAIQEAARVLDDKKFIPIYVGWTEYQGQSDHSALWERFHSICAEELTDEVRSTLGHVAGESVDYLMMVTIKNKGSGLCGIDGKCEPNGGPVIASVDKGLRALRQFGPSAFPWDETALKSQQQLKEIRLKNLKERLPGFEFLTSPSTGNGSGLLVRGSKSNEEGTEDTQETKYVPVDNLLGSGEKDEEHPAVLGLYFSAHWCPPCRAFTPELLKEYEDIRTKMGVNSFEVVFISFDNNEEEFNEYYSSMVTPKAKEQWLTLDYSKSREFAKDLTEVFGVRGFPSLVLLNRDGTILSNNARSSVSKYGADYFPWDAESVQRGKEKLLKKEEQDVESQLKQGNGVIVRRIVGPIGSIKYDATDRVLEFKNGFSTAVLDKTSATQEMLYYEVEIIERVSRHPIAQFGFALHDAFEKTNEDTGEGVGDNNKSWGVCGFRQELWHDGGCVPMEDPSSTCGWEVGDVLGFAVNVDLHEMAISKNGNWSKEVGCGTVFVNDALARAGNDGVGVYPALTCRGLKVRLNALEKDFRFSKPPKEMWDSHGDSPNENGTTA